MPGLTKYEKETIILTNEGDDFYEVYTFNSALKKKLAVYAKRHPDLCSLRGNDQGRQRHLCSR